MSGIYNSAELANQITKKLELNEEDSRKLYEQLSQLPNGAVKDAVARLVNNNTMNEYITIIKDSCVRDAQYSTHDDASWNDDGSWRDAEYMGLYIGIVFAETEVRARQIAAAQKGIDAGCVTAYLV